MIFGRIVVSFFSNSQKLAVGFYTREYQVTSSFLKFKGVWNKVFSTQKEVLPFHRTVCF